MQKWDQGAGWDIEEVIGVLLSSIGESGHGIDRMVAQWIIQRVALLGSQSGLVSYMFPISCHACLMPS